MLKSNKIPSRRSLSYLNGKPFNFYEEICQCKIQLYKKETYAVSDLKPFVLGEVEYLHRIGKVPWDVLKQYRANISKSFKENCTPLVKVK